MDKITNITELNQAILLLEAKQTLEGCMLKEQSKITYESLKPINLIKNTIKELASSPDFKADLINTSLGVVVGYLSKKLAIGETNNPFKQLLGTILQMGVTSVVAKNSDGLKSTVLNLIQTLFAKKETEPYE